MNRSANRSDSNWKREWEEEQLLTPEEQKEVDRDEAEKEKIFNDLMACIDEIEREDEHQEFEEYLRNIEEEKYSKRPYDEDDYTPDEIFRYDSLD